MKKLNFVAFEHLWGEVKIVATVHPINECGGEFWNDKPELVKEDKLIDLQLAAGIQGDFKKGWELAQQIEKETPDCPRAAFNRGWYLLHQGKLLEGHKLLDYGRQVDVFGSGHIGTTQPIWNGEEGTVLLNLEGGLGDQIKSCLLYTSPSPRD